MISLTAINQFQNQNGPIPLSQLDVNYAQLYAAINDAGTFDNFFSDSSITANIVTLTIPAPQTFSYFTGVMLQFKIANSTSIASPTINVNALGAKVIVNADGTSLVSGQFILTGSFVLVQYDGTSWRLIGAQNSSFAGLAATKLSVNGNATITGTTGGGTVAVGGIASGVATTILSLPATNPSSYLVFANITGSTAPSVSSASAIVSVNNSTANLTTIQTASQLAISVSGLSIQATQTTGSSATVSIATLRIL